MEINYTGPGVALRYGELFLKGCNRKLFEQALVKNVRRALKGRDDVNVVRGHGRAYVTGSDDEDIIARLRGVFGLASLSPVTFCEKSMETFGKLAVQMASKRDPGVKNFRIAARRSDKRFEHNSAEIGRIIGADVVREFGLGVDLERPDFTIGIEVGLEGTFMWSQTIKGAGGLPVGTSGRATLLLSGGIDSPVAGHLMQKRGLSLDAVYFHAFPYTSDGAKDKVIRLAGILAKRQNKLRLAVVPFTKMQELFRDKADPKMLVLLYRRAMIRIAQALAEGNHIPGLVTGESLGQVASQTLPNLAAIQDAATMPILRPLIGSDKNEVIEIAKKIGSFNISILPHDDCCSLFVPKHPETKANLERLKKMEDKIDWQPVLEETFNNIEFIDID